MSEKAEITAIFVTYNSAAVIAQALTPLYGQVPVMVVDNASADDTRELIRRDFPRVQLIENKKNEGFGRANNLALNQVKTPYALLVNPDAVITMQAVNALLEAAERYADAAILAPQLYDAHGQLDHSYKSNVFAREKKRALFTEASGDLCAEFLSGAVWLLNMGLIKKIGFFDPDIFLYYEDDDLCLRVRKAGAGLVLVHAAKAVHLKGASSGESRPEVEFFKQKQMVFSRLYMEEKYHGKQTAKRLAMKLNVTYAFKAAFYGVYMHAGKFNRYRGRLAGIVAFGSKKKGF